MSSGPPKPEMLTLKDEEAKEAFPGSLPGQASATSHKVIHESTTTIVQSPESSTPQSSAGGLQQKAGDCFPLESADHGFPQIKSSKVEVSPDAFQAGVREHDDAKTPGLVLTDLTSEHTFTRGQRPLFDEQQAVSSSRVESNQSHHLEEKKLKSSPMEVVHQKSAGHDVSQHADAVDMQPDKTVDKAVTFLQIILAL